MNRRRFALPTLIAVVTLLGLFAGLLGDGAADRIAAAALAFPVVMLGWAWRARRA